MTTASRFSRCSRGSHALRAPNAASRRPNLRGGVPGSFEHSFASTRDRYRLCLDPNARESLRKLSGGNRSPGGASLTNRDAQSKYEPEARITLTTTTRAAKRKLAERTTTTVDFLICLGHLVEIERQTESQFSNWSPGIQENSSTLFRGPHPRRGEDHRSPGSLRRAAPRWTKAPGRRYESSVRRSADLPQRRPMPMHRLTRMRWWSKFGTILTSTRCRNWHTLEQIKKKI